MTTPDPDDADFPDIHNLGQTPRSVRCKCSHLRADHYHDRRGRPVCASTSCGCIAFRPREEEAS